MIRQSSGRKLFVFCNYLFLTLLGLTMVLPVVHILAGSLSSGPALGAGKVGIVPVGFTLKNYRSVMGDVAIWRSFGVSAFVTITGTAINLVVTTLMAYALSRPQLKGRTMILLSIVFTMIFQMPIIPLYLLVKSLGMLDSLTSILIPNAVNAFNLIIMVTFFRSLPQDLLDQASIDGCGEYRVLRQIVVPISLAAFATIGLFYAVAHWNAYFLALMFIREPRLFPLQVRLRKLLIEHDAQAMMAATDLSFESVEGIKMAAIFVATVPILLIYPFIQKHFVRGATLGALKQ